MTRRHKGYTLREAVLSLAGQLNYIRNSFEIWWAMESAETRPRYVDALNRHVDFSRTTIEAHMAYFVVGLARLVDRRTDSLSLKTVANRAERENLDPTAVAKSRAALARVGAVAARAQQLRHDVYAHRSAGLSYSAAWKRASLTADALTELFEGLAEATNALLRAVGEPELQFDSDTRQDTLRILEALRTPGDKGGEIPSLVTGP